MWPLVSVRLARPATCSDEVEAFGDRMAGILRVARFGKTPTRIKILLVIDGIVDSPAEHQLLAAGIISRLRDDARAAVEATALVASNSVVRAIVNLVLRLQPLQSRHEIFETSEDALEWLHAQ